VPRNMVLVPRDDPAAFDERAFIGAVRSGRVMVSSGPFVELTANGQPIGSTLPEGSIELSVRVDAPPWVDVDHVQLLRRGEVLTEWKAPFKGVKGPHRFEQQVKETLHKGDWVIAIARGKKPMSPLFRRNAQPFAFTNPIWIN